MEYILKVRDACGTCSANSESFIDTGTCFSHVAATVAIEMLMLAASICSWCDRERESPERQTSFSRGHYNEPQVPLI